MFSLSPSILTGLQIQFCNTAVLCLKGVFWVLLLCMGCQARTKPPTNPEVDRSKDTYVSDIEELLSYVSSSVYRYYRPKNENCRHLLTLMSFQNHITFYRRYFEEAFLSRHWKSVGSNTKMFGWTFTLSIINMSIPFLSVCTPDVHWYSVCGSVYPHLSLSRSQTSGAGEGHKRQRQTSHLLPVKAMCCLMQEQNRV